MVYQFKSGSRIRGIDAQKTGEELEKIRSKNGGSMTPRDVVAAARRKTSPMHNYFEWRDDVAAEKWREKQAQVLIACVTVTHQEAQKPTRAYVSFRDGNEAPRFTGTADAMKDDALREQVLTAAYREFEAFRRRYDELEELAALFDAYDEMKATA